MADFEKVYKLTIDADVAKRATIELNKSLLIAGKRVEAVGRKFQVFWQQKAAVSIQAVNNKLKITNLHLAGIGKSVGLKKVGNDAVKTAAKTQTVVKSVKKVKNEIKKIGDASVVAGAKLSSMLKSANFKIKVLAKKISAVGRSMTLWVTGPIALMGGGAIKMATDYEEALDKVQVVFGDASKTVTDFTDNARKQFGLGKLSAIEMTSLFGDMATGMKIPQEEAAKLSIEMAKIAAETASLKNVPLDEIKTAFAGVFTGETESMKRIGVMIQQKNIQAWMKGEGIKGQINEMTMSEQALIRFRFVQDALSNSVGNFQLTQESAANKTRTFQESLSDLGIVFGREILPLFVKFVDKAQKVVEWLGNLDESTKETIIVVAGLVAVLGPLLFVVGKVIIAFQLLGAAIKLLALNPVIAAALVFIGVLGLLFTKMSTLTAYFEEAITDWDIWFKELGVTIMESAVKSLEWLVKKANEVWTFFGGEAFEVNFDAKLATEGLKTDIANLKEQRSRIDFDAAGKADDQRVKDLMGSYGLSFDLPEGKAPMTPAADKKKTKKKATSGSDFGIRTKQLVESQRVDRRLALMRSKDGAASGQSASVNVTVNAPINAPGGDPVRIQKGLERSLSKGLDRATKRIMVPAQ